MRSPHVGPLLTTKHRNPLSRNLYFLNMKSSFLTRPVKILYCGKSRCLPNWKWDTRETPLDCFDLWGITEGIGKLAAPDGDYSLSQGVVLLLRPGQRYVGTKLPEDPLTVLHFRFHLLDENGTPFFPKDNELPDTHRHMNGFRFMQDLLERAFRNHRDGNSPQSEWWFRSALMEMVRADRTPRATGPKERLIQKIHEICDQIEHQPGRPYPLTQLAKQAGCSVVHFSRVFKELHQEPPREYIIRKKVEVAKGLLLSSSQPIHQISDALGYSDVYFFSKQFFQKTGLRPSKFRKASSK